MPPKIALYVFASDEAVVKKVVRETSSGGVGVNETIMHIGLSFDLSY